MKVKIVEANESVYSKAVAWCCFMTPSKLQEIAKLLNLGKIHRIGYETDNLIPFAIHTYKPNGRIFIQLGGVDSLNIQHLVDGLVDEVAPLNKRARYVEVLPKFRAAVMTIVERLAPKENYAGPKVFADSLLEELRHERAVLPFELEPIPAAGFGGGGSISGNLCGQA